MSAEFEDYFTSVENEISDCVGGREKYAFRLAHKNYFRIKTAFYEDENPEGKYHKGSGFFVALGYICIGLWFIFYFLELCQF